MGTAKGMQVSTSLSTNGKGPRQLTVIGRSCLWGLTTFVSSSPPILGSGGFHIIITLPNTNCHLISKLISILIIVKSDFRNWMNEKKIGSAFFVVAMLRLAAFAGGTTGGTFLQFAIGSAFFHPPAPLASFFCFVTSSPLELCYIVTVTYLKSKFFSFMIMILKYVILRNHARWNSLLHSQNHQSYSTKNSCGMD